MIRYDPDRCRGCGRCVPVCHPGGRRISSGVMLIDPEQCAGCGECVRVCPVGATRWDSPFPLPHRQARLRRPETWTELVRNHRPEIQFRERMPEQHKIAALCRAHGLHHRNTYGLSVQAVTSPGALAELETELARSVVRAARLLHAPALFVWLRGLGRHGESGGARRVLHGAPVVLLVSARAGVPHVNVCVRHALRNLQSAAEHLGLECLPSDGLRMVLASRPRLLKLPEHHALLGVLLVGYAEHPALVSSGSLRV